MQKNTAKQLLYNSAEIAGGGLGAALGFLAGDPFAAAISGGVGAAAIGILKNIGKDFTERQLSPQEDIRVGKVLAIAALEIHQRLENGENLRDDGFFDEKPNGRSDAEEVAEAIMLKCQREPQEKKIPYMGYLKASIAFNPDISADMGHQIIKEADQLTYRQLCILKLCVVKGRFGLRNENYRDHGKFSKELYSVLYECMDLCQKEYIILREGHTLGLTDIVPQSMTVQGIGGDLFNLMKLSSIPDDDLIPIAKVLK